jgi:hypothetical protein
MTGYKILFGGIALLVVGMIGHAIYRSEQRAQERRAVLGKIQQEGPKSHADLFPDSFVYRWTDTKELPDVLIAGKKLTKGLTWDDALPVLEKGQRVWMERLDPDVFVDIRSFEGRQYGFSFARSDGRPYRLTTIESGTYEPKPRS